VSQPLVSIVTPSLNQGRFIERTVRSVLCQDYPAVEYIVLDAVSTDGTVEVLRQYQDAIDVLIVEKDKGQSDALDRGLRLARGDILAYLNADDCYAAVNTLSTVVKYFVDNPDVDVVFGRRITVDEEGRFVDTIPSRPFSADFLSLVDYISQEAAFWTRRIYERAGGRIDMSYSFAMDYELWLRFLRCGGRFLSVPEVFGLFRAYADQKTKAQWEAVGIPEIARLHSHYLGRTIPVKEMMDSYHEYLTGAHPARQPEVYLSFQRLWARVVDHHARVLRGVHLDGWVYDAAVHRRCGEPNWASAAA
jgi:glycosyltransferase involved in cell wall biosynthesis